MPVLIFCAVLHVFFAGTVSGGRKGRFLSVKTRLNPAAANAMGVLPPGEVISGAPEMIRPVGEEQSVQGRVARVVMRHLLIALQPA